MAFSFRKRTLKCVGVVGSGQIGPDIALHFAKVLSPYGTSIVVVDVSQAALDKGRSRLCKKIDKGVESGAFSADSAQVMKDAVLFTTDYQALKTADLVIEAASENEAIKHKIFSQLESLVGPDTILASNSSHMEPEIITSPLKFKERGLVIHYFFPAERNPVVEIVPGPDTSANVTRWLMGFYEAIGKVPITVKSRYGYALDPIFEGVFQAAALCVEDKLGTVKEVDFVATRALGLTVGPFTAMNLTGGNPITHHGLNLAHTRTHPWFKTPVLLDEALKSGKPWDVPARGEQVEINDAKQKLISERLQGTYLGLVDEVLTAGLVSVADMEMAVELALDMTPPLKLAREIGWSQSVELINKVREAQPVFPGPDFFVKAAASNGVEAPVVLREDREGVAVLTIRRPKVLNAMNQAVFDQLGEHIDAIAQEDGIVAAVVTGFGVKAFVSGADVKFLSAIKTPEDGIATSLRSQSVVNKIDRCSKPVVAAMNGLAFGGGIELAMACTARLAAKGIKTFVAQPEPNLGIIPGAGGTQRLPRLIGLTRGAELLRTGRPISVEQAVEYGLVLEAVESQDLLLKAEDLARDLASGSASVSTIERAPLAKVPEKLPETNIGHLSRAIDAIICRAVLEGARMSLEDGLKHEAQLFGDVCRTKDMEIGLTTFLTKGPKAKAEFTHS